jgi:hypothetical protein
MKFTDDLVNKFGTDTIMHFLVCGWGTMIFFTITHSVFASLIAMLIIGIAKEVTDIKSTGFSLMDLIADATGIAVSIILILIRG